MTEWYLVIKFAHVLGATILFGAGLMIAFFMLMAHRSMDVSFIANTLNIVVMADFVFTATAAILQPISGLALSYFSGLWPLPFWVSASIALYVLIGCFWLPVVFIQVRMRKLALDALSANEFLPVRYFQLFRIWFFCGLFAFPIVVAVFWLMITKPV